MVPRPFTRESHVRPSWSIGGHKGPKGQELKRRLGRIRVKQRNADCNGDFVRCVQREIIPGVGPVQAAGQMGVRADFVRMSCRHMLWRDTILVKVQERRLLQREQQHRAENNG